jgi:predicted PolB exonuclease-like 3'-5' exonuclease
MTNEDRLESRLFNAHDRGYYDDVIELIREYKTKYPEKSHYDLYDKALNECKHIWLLELDKLDRDE